MSPTAVGRCTECGALLAPDGSCPSCLLGLGFEIQAESEARVEPPLVAGQVRIGPYRILDVLGQGGMGIVYLAEQDRPIRRRVALKLIKPGMDSGQVLARFESERQALALMSHPNVAKVFDAGVSDDGRPYFVMEYVPGQPITAYCDRERLAIRERLDLFLQACDALQHAHQKGIIHRDVKPSNVLVCRENERATVKVIDFGVAKATSQKLTERTLHTQHGIVLGTPEYMSPEQAGATALDVDTRADIYSLGVVLYELLVGALPFDPQELRGAGLAEILHVIREVEPLKPSARLGTSRGPRLTESAHRRGVDGLTLRRQLAGDLDWIALKALEKDRARRYGSPAEMAADVARHLAHQPVLAGPPSAVYRTKKFVRRHRFGVATAIAGLVALIGFAGAMAVQTTRITREAQVKTRVTEFLMDLFKVSDPSTARGNSITARELLDVGATKIREDLENEPAIQAELKATMGTVYVRLGLYGQATPLIETALTTRQRVLGPEHPDTLASMKDLANAYYWQARYPEAEALRQERFEILRRVRGPEDPSTLAAMIELTIGLHRQGRHAEAEALVRETLAIQKRVLGPGHADTLRTTQSLAVACFRQGRFAEAEALYRETLEIQKQSLGPEHADTLRTMSQLAGTYGAQNRLAEAEAVHRQILEIQKRVLGPDHPETLASMSTLAGTYSGEGREAEAEALHRETLESRRRVLGPEHPDTLASMTNLANSYVRQDRYVEGEALLRESLEIRKRTLKPDHPETLRTFYNLARLEALRGGRAEALAYLRDATAHGFSEGDRMARDSDFASLQDDPEFAEIVASAKENRERAAPSR